MIFSIDFYAIYLIELSLVEKGCFFMDLKRKLMASFLSLVTISSLLSMKGSSSKEIKQYESLESLILKYIKMESLKNGVYLIKDTLVVKEEGEKKVTLDEVDYSKLFSYDNRTVEGSISIANGIRELLSGFSLEEKYEYAFNKAKVTEDEFNTVLAVLGVESGPTCYVDGFATMTNVLNRTISYKYSYYVSQLLGREIPLSIYHHIIAPGQYGPFWSKSYLENMGKFDTVTVEAFLDVICSYDLAPRMHDYLNFYEWENVNHNGVYYIRGGNKFENLLKENDIMPLEERYYYIDGNQLSLNK